MAVHAVAPGGSAARPVSLQAAANSWTATPSTPARTRATDMLDILCTAIVCQRTGGCPIKEVSKRPHAAPGERPSYAVARPLPVPAGDLPEPAITLPIHLVH